MADVVTRVDNLEVRLSTLEQKIDTFLIKLDMFNMQAMNKKIDDDVHALIMEIREFGNNVCVADIIFIVVVAAMVIAILLK